MIALSRGINWLIFLGLVRPLYLTSGAEKYGKNKSECRALNARKKNTIKSDKAMWYLNDYLAKLSTKPVEKSVGK